ncbi:MAG: ATP-binding protein [Pseudomonadota bacterium]|nr:ATP-binding protein [Pseudomonadota bacterium]
MPHAPSAQTRRVVSAIRPTPGESTAHFNELLERLPAGAYTCNVDGLITYFNKPAEDLWGRAPRLNHAADRFCGSFRLFDKNGVPVPHEECWTAIALRHRRQYNGKEIIIERPSGERVTALAHVSPIKDKNGRVVGIVNVVVDITDRKRFEAALHEADRSKNDFLATLAHELRNPLAPVRSALQILRMSGVHTPEAKAALDIADRQMLQMVRLVEDLLDVSRITRNKLQLQRAIVPLQDVVQLGVESSKPAIDSGGQVFRVDVPLVPVYVDVDSARMAQVLSNLLHNAAKFTPAGGCITLGASLEGEEAVISVRDTGIGLSEQSIPTIFEMFAQAAVVANQVRGGLGIGLSLAKRLVEMHGGSVAATSRGPGEGSEFIVRLPTAAAPAAARPEEATAPQNQVQALRLLVVDDNRDAADTLCVLLQMLGHEARVAYDGESALDEAQDYRPDMVLLDIGMPKADGYVVARRIRKQPWGKGTVLVATTGWGQSSDKEQARQAGFNHHLVKPIDLDALNRILSQVTLH